MTFNPANPVPAELWAAYLASHYEVAVKAGEWLSLAIGKPAAGMEHCWQGDSEAFIVTAHNPLSQQLPPEENQQREAALLKQIRAHAYRYLPTKAVDMTCDVLKKWPDERGVLIFDATIHAAIQLAVEFQQLAIVRVPRAGLVECLPVYSGE